MEQDPLPNGIPLQGFDGDSREPELLSSSTKRRTQDLKLLYERLVNHDVPDDTQSEILQSLCTTYALYVDRRSRMAVQQCLRILLSSSHKELNYKHLSKFLESETAKPGLAPSSFFALVEWSSIALQEIRKDILLWHGYGLKITHCFAQVLARCLEESIRATIRHSALVIARRGIRVLLKSNENASEVAKEIILSLTKKGPTPTAHSALLLGVVAGVCDRLSALRPILQQHASDYYGFFNRELLGSRLRLPAHIANGLKDFFVSSAVTLEGLEQDIFPAVEKALLRAPEVVLVDLLTPLITSLKPGLDLSRPLRKNLIKPLLSNSKSSNKSIRDGSIEAFRCVASASNDETALLQIAEELTKALKETKAAEQRIPLALMLGSIIPSQHVSTKIIDFVVAYAAKETNENSLFNETTALKPHIISAVRSGWALSDGSVKMITAGLNDRKLSVRRIWALLVGEAMWETSPDVSPAIDFFRLALENLLISWEEVMQNPVTAAQSGYVTIAFVVAAICSAKFKETTDAELLRIIKKCNLDAAVVNEENKPAFLTNLRVYGKLTTTEDYTWFVRALVNCVPALPSRNSSAEDWSQAALFSIASVSVPLTVRREAFSSLKRTYAGQPQHISRLLIDGLWVWLKDYHLDVKDSAAIAARTGKNQLYLAIQAMFVKSHDSMVKKNPVPPEILKEQLKSCIVLCREPLIKRINWLDLRWRTPGVQPIDLLTEDAASCADEVIASAGDLSNHHMHNLHEAACGAVMELSLIAPEVMPVTFLEFIKRDLNPENLDNIGPTEIAMFHTPPDITYVDVLSQKAQVATIDKKTKDYDTLKWEQELREQLAAKKNQQKKLTADEQAKVKTQLAKEAAIREYVGQVKVKLQRGIGFAYSLVKHPIWGAENWLSSILDALLKVMDAGASLLVGDAAAMAYLACSERISDRLGEMRRFIGVATLRAHQNTTLPTELEAEPLGDQITRILYRLRFAGEQRPFDTLSLLYILPLVHAVLEQGGIDKAAGEEADEQITLAVEFLSFHTDLFSNTKVPRQQTCRLLFYAMQRFNQHYRSLKDCALAICHAIAPDLQHGELDVFLRTCIVPEATVRLCALQAIDNDLLLDEKPFYAEIFLALHDDDQENVDVAREIWDDSSLKTSDESFHEILPYIESKDQALSRAAARALADLVNQHPDTFSTILSKLQELYVEKSKPKVPQKDAYGMPIKTDLSDSWEPRYGVALSFKSLAPSFPGEELVTFIEFLIEHGPLADKEPRVRDEMSEAATSLISLKGAAKVEDLMIIFEATLDMPDKGNVAHDMVNEATIVMYGALARHLKAGDQRVPKVANRLLKTLDTPSETVQFAICRCLPPLVRNSQAETANYVKHVMSELLESKKYASRRGAAYGLAGIVQGQGLSSLKEFRILSTLRAASEEKKDQNRRQGAFLAYEVLSLTLGSLFEPYTIEIVPQLLTGFGDPSADVRDACLDAAKSCFSTLSSFGVKKILPTLLEGLDEQQWRSKKGASDSLGAMAYLDPQQLAFSLPEIIPSLTNVLNDSHKEVRNSANRSLQRFGEVISNPEIKQLVPILLKALSDPTKHTDEALDSLLKVSFIHYLDAPSLALVVRILERGLSERSSTKRKAAQIIGSLAHLTERKDLTSHLPILVAGLRVASVDPVPSTRATASKALGSLVEKLGEDALPDLIPSLMATLKTEAGAGDRLGSAQALSEVLAGLGIARLEEMLPNILQNVSSSKATVREGFMSLFIFLPACFGSSFANYLSRIIPPILSGLADDVESIRETSLRAGRLLVKNFASRAIDLLLPELQRGLGDDNHRIRLSSVELVGDLLFNLTGISGKTEEEEAEENATAAGQSLLEVLGEEKRNNILSALYISRCDISGLVRSAAMNVWKALVPTPRTLREITPTLTQVIIRRLASSNMEQKHIAGNALGELIRKAGDGVLASLLPTLEEGLQTSMDTDTKQGICIAMRELISSASPEALADYEPKLISVVRTALVDRNAEVREAAAEAFDSLQRIFGKKVVDQILPNLLGLLRDQDEAENALAALLTLLTENTRSSIILPNLLPTLLASPISAFNARALASLASVAGSAMTRRLSNILNSLLDNIVSCREEERLEALNSSFDTVLLSVDEYDGLSNAMSTMLSLSKHDDHRKRAAADMHLASFFQKTELDYSRYYPDLIRALLISFDDGDTNVVQSAWAALNALTSRLRKEDMESLVAPTRQVLSQVGVPGRELPGFALPKGIMAILPIFLQGLANGTPEQRTQSAMAIDDIIDKTSSDSLKPFVTNITGPLIRVVSERSVDVKAAILLTLNHLLEKIPTFLRPFLPQLQRTFTKALADPTSETLRSRAARAIGTLITLTPRIDPLIGELVTGSKTSDTGVKTAMQKALYEVVSKVGGNMNDASRAAIIALVDDDATTADANASIANARLLGALVKTLPPDAAAGIVRSRVLTPHHNLPSVLALNAILLDSPGTLTQNFETETLATVAKGITQLADTAVADNCVLAAGKFLLTPESNKSYDALKPLFDALATTLQPGTPTDARRLALVVVRTVAREHNEVARPHLSVLAPLVFGNVRDPVVPIKLAAEAAFLELFAVIDEETAVFDKFMAGPAGSSLSPNVQRSMREYFKRIAVRLAAQARERREAEGGVSGNLGLSNDEKEDEREIWSVGRVDLGDGAGFEA